MAISTRNPSGVPAWDLTLIAGGEKKGKSYAAAQASSIDYIGRTFWIPFGENEPDEYGKIPGARFEIVNMDDYGGITYAGVMNAIRAAIAEPRVDPAKPNLIVLDSGGRVWTYLSERADYAARKRLAKKQQLDAVPLAEDVAEEINVTSDLWNSATELWNDMIQLLKSHDGPVIMTTLLEEVTVFKGGQPTKEKEWKVLGQKRLAADAGIVIEIPKLREVYVTGVRSLSFEPVKTGEHTKDTRFRDFTVEKLWAALGLGPNSGRTAHANIVSAKQEDAAAQQPNVAQQILDALREVRDYATPEQVLTGLTAVCNHFGEDAMQAARIPVSGQMVPAAEIVATIRQRAEAAIAAAQQEQPAQTECAPEPAQEPSPAQPESEGAVRAADQTARDDTRHLDTAYKAFYDEIAGQAATLGVQVSEYVKPLLATNTNATHVYELPKALVHRWISEQRPTVVTALRAQGRATQAEAYESVPPQAWGNFDHLTGANARSEEPARETADAN